MTLWFLLFTACLPPFEGDEVAECVDRVDNDGDGFFDCDDPDCAGSQACLNPEICDNGFDDDGDGRVDCGDSACFDELGCQPEDCTNGVDDNGNGLADCADPDCYCEGYALWTVEGSAAVDDAAFTGDLTMLYTVTANGGLVFEVGDTLCEARYTMASTGVSDTCTSCDFAFTFDPTPLDTSFGGGQGYDGPYCDAWVSFAQGGQFNPISWLPGLGWDGDYTGSEMRFYYDYNGYTAWYAMANSDGELDTGTGAFTWTWTVGEYAY